jgi:hypothetical protein
MTILNLYNSWWQARYAQVWYDPDGLGKAGVVSLSEVWSVLLRQAW